MIYRVIRKLKAVLYHAIVEPDIKHSFAECGKDSHIESGGDFFPLSNIHIGNHASIGVNARFWTTRAQIYLSLIHISEPRDVEESRMPSSA